MINMPLSTQPYKGTRDFYPEDKQLQNYMFNTMRKVAERHGYRQYDAPILEPIELYKAKSGQEIVDEQTYAFTDRGGREIAIRPEMTPTVSRMVAAKRQELGYPLRLYSIPNLWRYERPQRGRLREHWQLNVDLFGEKGLSADHEIIMLSDELLKAFGATTAMYQIKFNSRKLTDELLNSYIGLDDVKSHKLIKILDRTHKVDANKLKSDVDELLVGLAEDATQKVYSLFEINDLDMLPNEVKTNESVSQLRELADLLKQSGVDNAVFDITLMRGFDYYTDIVFEVMDSAQDNNRSMFGGGRYDGLVELFGVDRLPTVGFGMGDVTLMNFLETHKLLPELSPPTDLMIIQVGNVYLPASRLASKLRRMDLNVAIDASERKLDKKLKNAVKHGIRRVLFVGEQELAAERYTFKDLVSGQEDKLSVEQIETAIKDHRR